MTRSYSRFVFKSEAVALASLAVLCTQVMVAGHAQPAGGSQPGSQPAGQPGGANRTITPLGNQATGAAGQASQVGQAAQPGQTGAGASGRQRRPVPTKIVIPGLHLSKEVPVNFPVPVYPSGVSRKNFVNSTKGSPTADISLTTSDDITTVYNWYAAYFAREKWAVKAPTAAAMEKLRGNKKLYFLEATRDRNQVNLICTADPKGGTRVSVCWAAIKAK